MILNMSSYFMSTVSSINELQNWHNYGMPKRLFGKDSYKKFYVPTEQPNVQDIRFKPPAFHHNIWDRVKNRTQPYLIYGKGS